MGHYSINFNKTTAFVALEAILGILGVGKVLSRILHYAIYIKAYKYKYGIEFAKRWTSAFRPVISFIVLSLSRIIPKKL